MSSLELQKAIVARLKADAGVTALVGQKIYERVPAGAEFPYVTLTTGQVIPERADCYKGYEVFRQIDVWSRAVGSPEAQRIAMAIESALDGAPLSLAGYRLHELTLEASPYPLTDPDGITTHIPLTFRALIDPV